MSGRRSSIVLFLAAFLAILPTVHAAPSRLEFVYTGPITIEGGFEGACLASGVAFPEQTSTRLHAFSNGGVLHLRDTWINSTIVDGRVVREIAHQDERSEPVPTGPIDVGWDVGGSGAIYQWGRGQPGPWSAFGVRLNVSRLETGPNTNDFRGPASFYRAAGSGVAWLDEGRFSIHTRRANFLGYAVATGNLSLHLRGAQIEVAGASYAVPPPAETSSAAGLPGTAEVRSVRIQDAFLDLSGALLSLPHDAVLACDIIEGAVRGMITAHRARGSALVGGERLELDDGTWNLGGDFGFRDRDFVVGDREWTRAEADGDVRVLRTGATDQIPEIPAPELTLPTIGLLGLAAAALIVAAKSAGHLAGFFYARVGRERALEHPRRRLLYDAVLADPGADLSQLAARLDCHLNSLIYHVRVLQRCGRIGIVRHGKSLRVLPKEAMPTRAGLFPAALLRYDPKFSFLRDLVQGGPRPLTEVVDAVVSRFGLSRRGALHVVHRAERRSLIERRAPSDGSVKESILIAPVP